jgi:hypothetical protein
VTDPSHCPPGFLTSDMIIQRTGMTEAMFRGLCTRRILRASKKTGYGRPLYTIAAVENAIHRMNVKVAETPDGELGSSRLTPLMYSYEAETASEVAKMLREGKNLGTIFIETGYHPRLLDAISRDLAKLTRSVFVPAVVLEAIERLPLVGTLPIADADELLHVLRATLKSRTCACGDGAEICRGCAKRLGTGEPETPKKDRHEKRKTHRQEPPREIVAGAEDDALRADADGHRHEQHKAPLEQRGDPAPPRADDEPRPPADAPPRT